MFKEKLINIDLSLGIVKEYSKIASTYFTTKIFFLVFFTLFLFFCSPVLAKDETSNPQKPTEQLYSFDQIGSKLLAETAEVKGVTTAFEQTKSGVVQMTTSIWKIVGMEGLVGVVLLIVLGWVFLYFRHRHENDKWKKIEFSDHPHHKFFNQISYKFWLLKHLPLKLQSKNVSMQSHKPYSVKDDFLILIFHPAFKALRFAVFLWMIFSLTLGSTGIYFLFNAHKTKAASDFSIKTGYYYGNGTTLSIAGVGFKPEVLMIKSDTAAGQLVWKSSEMPANESSYLGVATANNTETEIILDNDGFTVSPALEVNTKNVRYTYIAFAGSDCTSADTSMCVGKYTGDGLASKAISTGFQPDLVWVKRTGAVVGNFTTSVLAAVNPTYAAYFSATANDTLGTGLLYKSLNAGGFTVGLTNNVLGAVHYYVAFKNVAGKSIVGSFTGDGVDNRNIASVGFEPDFVFVKQNSAVGPAFNTTECWGDNSLAFLAGASALNHIQSLDADGFQVGNSTAVNTGGILSYWFAFGGAPDPAPTESFVMETGHYAGDGQAAHIISTSFAPDLVFIKADDSAQYAVWSTRRDTDITHYFSYAAASFASGIISMGDASFTLGNHVTVNTNLTNYEYIAFGNATSPQTGAHAADFMIGSYTGNGLTPTTASRVIDHLGMTPDMVVVKPTVVSAASNINYWKSSSMTTANETGYFTATANDTGGTLIQSLDSANGGGFTMGSNAYVNTLGVVYVFFAFKEGNGTFSVGTYDGTGAADREVTGIGFQPDFVWTKRNTNTAAAHRSSSDGITGENSQHFLATANATNMITNFLTDGFEVGSSAYVNSSTVPKAYHYAAWKATNNSHPPVTPTDSTPIDGAINQDLNTTLVGSAYSDIDSDEQTNARWQVDDDTDFLTPIWTRTAGAAEITTSITSGNGVFANELAGKTELDHNSTYYWRVSYSDGVYSSWSTAKNFTTNTFSTPTNSSPADQATVTTLTPTLTTSAFSDAQTSHTTLKAQWQINTSNSFTTPLYDSGEISYGASYVVPNATLADKNVYYWRVRYQDSGGQWSAYSTATRFLVSQSEGGSIASIKPLFGSVVVDQSDEVKIDAQFLSSAGAPINDATVTINIYNPGGTKIETSQSMTYVTDSNGIYRFTYTIPAVSGSYLYEVTAVSGSTTGYGAANFEVRTIAANVSSVKSTVESEQTAQTTERAAQATERTSQTASRTKVEDIQTRVIAVQSDVTTIKSDVSSAKSTVESVQSKLNTLAGTLPSSYSGVYEQLVSIASTLSGLGVLKGSGAESLYSVSADMKNDVHYLSNKILDMQAAIEINRNLLTGGRSSISSTWYTFNSVVLNMLIANPTNRKTTIPFKASLPKEAKPEHIISSGGFKVEFDEVIGSYVVADEFELDAGESITRSIEMKDIWLIDETEVGELKRQAEELADASKKTAYSGQAVVLKNDTLSRIGRILRKQKDATATPQDHILAFRENQDDLTVVKENLKKMTDLVTSVGAGGGLLASIAGINTFMTWGIIVVLISGIVLLGLFSYSMWKHQMMIVAQLTGKAESKLLTTEGMLTSEQAAFYFPKIRWKAIFAPLKKIFLTIAVIGIVLGTIKGIISFKKQEQSTVIGAVDPEQIVMPSLSPTPTPESKKVVILQTETGWVNVRSKPGINFEKIAQVDVGKKFVEIQRVGLEKGEEWVKIQVDDKTEGWISGKYTEEIKL